jgi:hypothetical protein
LEFLLLLMSSCCVYPFFLVSFHLFCPPCCGWLPAVFSIHAVVGDFAGVGSLLLTLFLLLLASLPFFSTIVKET